MTLTIDDVIALRANCDDYANPLRAVYYAARLLELPKPILYCV